MNDRIRVHKTYDLFFDNFLLIPQNHKNKSSTNG